MRIHLLSHEQNSDIGRARHLYEKIGCARGGLESRINEAGSAGSQTAPKRHDPGQPAPLVVCRVACVLQCTLRRIGLAHVRFAEAACATILGTVS